jgi:hypothetical protein
VIPNQTPASMVEIFLAIGFCSILPLTAAAAVKWVTTPSTRKKSVRLCINHAGKLRKGQMAVLTDWDCSVCRSKIKLTAKA